MSTPRASAPAEDSGSFRDRSGQVYRAGDRVLRGVDGDTLKHFRALRETGFYREHAAAGRIVETREIDAPSPGPAGSEWAGWLQHERIPFITYPYEWTFGMLRDAAVLQLRLLEDALQEGWTLKDATPYNIQFVGTRPVFIDLPSFEPAGDQPWAGYRQFCEMFLFPLMLQAYRGVDFQPFLRARIGGIPVADMDRLMRGRGRLRPGVTPHVTLQALLERRHGDTRRDIRGELGSAGFNRELVLANVRRLLKLVRRLQWRPEGSEWSDYTEQHNYTEAGIEHKRRFVDEAIVRSDPISVWDVGCNTGQFALLAAGRAPVVLAMDADHLAVERLYRDPAMREGGRILPLVQNVADPSPDWGWALRERRALAARGRPGLILCLALVHHIVIGANVPLRRFIDWLASLGGDLVIEFVGRGDDKVETLLRNRVDQYDDYHPAPFEDCLARHYELIAREELPGGNRVLYHARPHRPAE